MIPPILFVDEKKEANSDDYRYKKLERKLNKLDSNIEFIADLDLKYSINKYTGEVDYEPNTNFDFREIVFIHSSLDSPKYPESVVNKSKSIHSNTTFVKFSGGRDLNLRKENLNFKREEHIYNFDKMGFEIFIKFYKETKKPEFYFFEHGIKAFDKKREEVDITFQKIKFNIKNQQQLNSRKLDGNFISIMRLANIYEDKDRFEKGKKYIYSINNIEEYFFIIEKYVKSIYDSIDADKKLLTSIL